MFAIDNLQLLEQIADDFHAINREHRREVDVVLFTPAQLDAATLEYYKATIALNFLQEGDNLIFTHHVGNFSCYWLTDKVDSNITSGYRVVVKEKVHDFSHDAARKAFREKLEYADAAKLNQAEGRVKAAAGVTDSYKKELEAAKKVFGIDAAWEQNFEQQSDERLNKFEQARVQLYSKLAEASA